jgi:hypothetical protein
MATTGLIEYANASAEVRAIYDDIVAHCFVSEPQTLGGHLRGRDQLAANPLRPHLRAFCPEKLPSFTNMGSVSMGKRFRKCRWGDWRHRFLKRYVICHPPWLRPEFRETNLQPYPLK